jgi:hypothetical protein
MMLGGLACFVVLVASLVGLRRDRGDDALPAGGHGPDAP